MNWNSCCLDYNTLHFQKLAHDYLFFRNIIKRRPSIKYKNRSLVQTYSFISKLSNFFVYKGLKLKYLKIFNYASVFFLHKLYNNPTPAFFFQKYRYKDVGINFDSFYLITQMVDGFSFFSDFNILLPSLLEQATSMIKPLVLKRKFFKKKKIPNRVKTKFNIRYIYVPADQRFFTTLRWFGMLLKFSKKPLVQRFFDMTLNSSLENNSLLIKLRNYVYERLAQEHD